MAGVIKRAWIRLSVTVRQSAVAIAATAAWLLVNWAVFAQALGLPWSDAALVALCIRKAEGGWGRFYASFTEVAVFGVVASMMVANATRRYRPEATSAVLAERASGHLVVIGYSNLGKRVRDMAAAAGGAVVVIEEDRALVDEIVRAEEPLVLGSAREPAVLRAARVERAEVVVVATDDLETAAVACRIVRDVNPRCKLVVRCTDDDVGQLLAKAYAARVLSTSKIAARFIREHAQKVGARRAVILGRNNVGRRAAEALAAERIACELIAETDDVEALRKAGVAEADLVVVADDDLGKNLMRVDRVRDMNPTAAVICRVFHEDAAEILAQRPFLCVVLSTSRLAAETLASEGILKGVGVVGLKKRERKQRPA
jgi:Trk K+ transport system NAD-binding subunit